MIWKSANSHPRLFADGNDDCSSSLFPCQVRDHSILYAWLVPALFARWVFGAVADETSRCVWVLMDTPEETTTTVTLLSSIRWSEIFAGFWSTDGALHCHGIVARLLSAISWLTMTSRFRSSDQELYTVVTLHLPCTPISNTSVFSYKQAIFRASSRDGRVDPSAWF